MMSFGVATLFTIVIVVVFTAPAGVVVGVTGDGPAGLLLLLLLPPQAASSRASPHAARNPPAIRDRMMSLRVGASGLGRAFNRTSS
jgi:hypothetical protein